MEVSRLKACTVSSKQSGTDASAHLRRRKYPPQLPQAVAFQAIVSAAVAAGNEVPFRTALRQARVQQDNVTICLFINAEI